MFDNRQIRLLFFRALCIASILFSTPAVSKGYAFDPSRVVEVSLGGSTILNMKPKSATLTDQTIAEISKSMEGILLIGRKVGETNLVVVSESGSETFLIKVSLPALAIQSEIVSLFPNERDVRAKAVGGALVLEGTVSTIQVINQMEAVAKGYLLSPSIVSLGVKPNVINLLTVRSPQQVQIDVAFAEVNRSSLRQIGAMLEAGKAGNTGNFRFSSANGLSVSTSSGFGELFLNPDPSGRLPIPLGITLKLLNEHSLSRTLAKPTLVAMSGEKATFLAGGEQPVPQVSGFGQPSVEYKKFGIQLDFSPIVLGDRTIELNTTMSVSVLDKSQGLQIGGTDIPLFRTRSSGTTVRLQHGQSFAIAGLLQDQLENVKRGVPGLGDIPILGVLFNSRQFQRNETELVVMVTARLVNPVNGANMPPVPGSESRDPNDVGVFLMNVFEESKMPKPSVRKNFSKRRRPRADLDQEHLKSSEDSATIVGAFGYWR
ncbi:MAG: hypothetical protein CMH49_03645 [Myxococcales bacterium]|nr:hypothetical protein [Myxococcales bacterium]